MGKKKEKVKEDFFMTLFEGKVKEEYEIKGFILEQSITRILYAL